MATLIPENQDDYIPDLQPGSSSNSEDYQP